MANLIIPEFFNDGISQAKIKIADYKRTKSPFGTESNSIKEYLNAEEEKALFNKKFISELRESEEFTAYKAIDDSDEKITKAIIQFYRENDNSNEMQVIWWDASLYSKFLLFYIFIIADFFNISTIIGYTYGNPEDHPIIKMAKQFGFTITTLNEKDGKRKTIFSISNKGEKFSKKSLFDKVIGKYLKVATDVAKKLKSPPAEVFDEVKKVVDQKAKGGKNPKAIEKIKKEHETKLGKRKASSKEEIELPKKRKSSPKKLELRKNDPDFVIVKEKKPKNPPKKELRIKVPASMEKEWKDAIKKIGNSENLKPFINERGRAKPLLVPVCGTRKDGFGVNYRKDKRGIYSYSCAKNSSLKRIQQKKKEELNEILES